MFAAFIYKLSSTREVWVDGCGCVVEWDDYFHASLLFSIQVSSWNTTVFRSFLYFSFSLSYSTFPILPSPIFYPFLRCTREMLARKWLIFINQTNWKSIFLRAQTRPIARTFSNALHLLGDVNYDCTFVIKCEGETKHFAGKWWMKKVNIHDALQLHSSNTIVYFSGSLCRMFDR